MEVKGVKQKARHLELDSHFEEVFDESQNKVATTNQDDKSSQELTNILLFNTTNPILLKEPMFIKLKEWMDKFHKEIQERNGFGDIFNSEDRLKILLYECLVKLLKEIAIVQDHKMQLKYLQRVYDWFAKRQLKPRSILKPKLNLKTTVQKRNTQKPLELSKTTPEKMHEDDIRALYTKITLPKESLKNFARREVKDPNIKASPKTLPQKELSSIKSIEAKSTYLYYLPEKPIEQRLERMWFAKKNRDITNKRRNQEFFTVLNQWGRAKAKLNAEMVRKHENIICANNFGVRNQNFQNLKGFLNKSAMIYRDLYELCEEESSESDNEEGVVIKESTPIKKPEVIDLTHSTGKLPLKKKSVVRYLLPEVRNTIQEGDKRRVDYIRRMYGNLINASNDNTSENESIFVTGPKGINSLSVYNKDIKRSYTKFNAKSLLSRSTPITHIAPREQFRIQEMKEVNRTQDHLARKEIPCTMSLLKRAILAPEDCSKSMITPENFPKPGSRLLVNPFAIMKKVKKKMKKKR